MLSRIFINRNRTAIGTGNRLMVPGVAFRREVERALTSLSPKHRQDTYVRHMAVLARKSATCSGEAQPQRPARRGGQRVSSNSRGLHRLEHDPARWAESRQGKGFGWFVGAITVNVPPDPRSRRSTCNEPCGTRTRARGRLAASRNCNSRSRGLTERDRARAFWRLHDRSRRLRSIPVRRAWENRTRVFWRLHDRSRRLSIPARRRAWEMPIYGQPSAWVSGRVQRRMSSGLIRREREDQPACRFQPAPNWVRPQFHNERYIPIQSRARCASGRSPASAPNPNVRPVPVRQVQLTSGRAQ